MEREEGETLMRCDLHVHSLRSGAVNLPVLRHLGRECYSTPEEVYALAKRRGMDLVTLTDHDTIDGALELADRADAFVSEEVTVTLPGGSIVHVNVFDITPAHHDAIVRVRNDAEAFFAFVAEANIPASLNHPFSPMTGGATPEDLSLAFRRLPLVEARNAMMPALSNDHAQRTARAAGCGLVAGSDAHALRSVARAYTEVPGARSKTEFLAGLRSARTVPRGGHGSYAGLVADVSRVFTAGYGEALGDLRTGRGDFRRLAGLLALAPFLWLAPFVAVVSHAREGWGAQRLHATLRGRPGFVPALSSGTLGV
jgi:predicted metal-dependent phosphoesterase TrpH